MPNRITEELGLGRLGRRHVQANFDGADLSTDCGLMLLRQIDARIATHGGQGFDGSPSRRAYSPPPAEWLRLEMRLTLSR